MKLIDDWRQAWRFHTVIVAVLLAVANFATKNSDALANVLPPDLMHQVNVWTPLLLIVLRVVQQQIPAPSAPPSPADPVSPKES